MKQLALLMTVLPLALAFGTEVSDLTRRLSLRNELTLSTSEIRPFLNNQLVKDRLAAWLSNEKIAP